MSGTVVVTGASTGIGRATAELLAERGFDVIAGVRKAGAAPPGERIEEVILDITDADQIAALAARFDGQPLAGLVNNAGMPVAGPVEFVPLDEMKRLYETNLFGHVAMTQAFLPALRWAQGRIVNTGSIGGRMALPFGSAYTSSKFALRALTDSLRQEIAPQGIRVVLVEPGAIKTEIWRKTDELVEDLDGQFGSEAVAIYGDQLRAGVKATRRSARTAIPPRRVAKVIARALTARRPRAHYLVGPDARLQALVARMPPAVNDGFLRLMMR